MRIVNIVESFSPVSETFIYNFVVGLAQRGHESHVITLRREIEQERPYDEVTVLAAPPLWSPSRLALTARRRAGLIDAQEQASELFRDAAHNALQELQPDIIHAHFGPMGVLIAPVAHQLKIPLVTTFLGYDISRLPRIRRWQRHYQQLACDIDAAVGISNHICRRLEEIGFSPDKIHRIPLGVNLSRLTYRDPASEYSGRQLRCLHVGRLTHKKSPVRLIQAFAIARNKLLPDIDLHLSIAGDGPLRLEVEQAVSHKNLTGIVKLLGAIKHKEVLELLRQSHIYTQYCETAPDGDQEGQGITFAEASASGLPIITTRHNGIPDVVLDGKTGYLVEEGDVEGMAERIVELARNPQKWTEFGRAGRAHIEANFTLAQQVDKSLALYEKILKQRSL